jgi:hypothetical protein
VQDKAQDTGIRFPDVHVQLTGTDGNTFFLMGRVAQALKRAGHADAVDKFIEAVTSSQSYEEALGVMTDWVDVS